MIVPRRGGRGEGGGRGGVGIKDWEMEILRTHVYNYTIAELLTMETDWDFASVAHRAVYIYSSCILALYNQCGGGMFLPTPVRRQLVENVFTVLQG